MRTSLAQLRGFFAVLILGLALSACALPNIFQSVADNGGDAVDQAYALMAEFNEIDAAALEFAQKPDTPPEAVSLLKKLRGPAAAAVPVIAEAAKTARQALNELAKEDNPDTVAQATTAVNVLNDRFDTYSPVVKRFIEYVNSL